MRYLTITRTKSFVASLRRMKVYIEDPTGGELLINKVPCRKLGVLKNGETRTFQISEDSARVFVIVDKLSRNYCNDFYQLPQGAEDVFLTGRNHFNMLAEHAFRFDDNNSEEVRANRKKGARVGAIVLASAIILGFALGFFIGSGIVSSLLFPQKTFSSDGMSITLNERFKQTEVENYTLAFESKEVTVTALKEPFALAEGFEDYSLTQYGEQVLKANNLATELNTKDGLTYFSYQGPSPTSAENQLYFAFLYKSDDAFWIVQFSGQVKEIFTQFDDVLEWAKSVEFSAGTLT